MKDAQTNNNFRYQPESCSEGGVKRSAGSQIGLSNYQLSQLLHNNEKVGEKIEELNELGMEKINEELYQEAILYFQQCEKILEYAASCGCSIDRSHIIAILNNEACVYQRIGEINQSISYVEAIIYNLTTFIQNHENVEISNQIKSFQDQPNPLHFQSISTAINSLLTRKYDLSIYYLRFSGLNSINQNHKQSLKYAEMAISLMKQVCLFTKIVSEAMPSHNNTNLMLLHQLTSLPDQFALTDYEIYMKKIKKIIFTTDSPSFFGMNTIQIQQKDQQRLQNLSFSQILTLQPQSLVHTILEELGENQGMEICTSQSSHFFKAIYLSMAYFAVSAELLQLNNVKQTSKNTCIYLFSSNDFDHEKSTQQQRTIAEIYHLVAILIGQSLIPFETKFTNFLFENYNETYGDGSVRSETSLVKNQIPALSHIDTKMDILKEKYKDFLIEKDADQFDSFKHEDIQSGILKSQGKECGKKLNQLFNNEAIKHKNKPQCATKYISDLDEIQSIQMSKSMTSKSIKPTPQLSSTEGSFQPQDKKKVIFSEKHLKLSIVPSQNESKQSDASPSTAGRNNSSSISKIQSRLFFRRTNQNQAKHFNQSKSKSKSKSKKSNNLKNTSQGSKSGKKIQLIKSNKDGLFKETNPHKELNFKTKSIKVNLIKSQGMKSIKMNKVKSPPTKAFYSITEETREFSKKKHLYFQNKDMQNKAGKTNPQSNSKSKSKYSPNKKKSNSKQSSSKQINWKSKEAKMGSKPLYSTTTQHVSKQKSVTITNNYFIRK